MPQNGGGVGQGPIDALRADDPRVLQEAARRERLEIGKPARRQRAADLAVGVEDPAVRVAKRARLGSS